MKLDIHTLRIAWNEGVREYDGEEDIWVRMEELQQVGVSFMICAPHQILNNKNHEG